MKKLLISLVVASVSTTALAAVEAPKKGKSANNAPGFYVGAGLGGLIGQDFNAVEDTYVKAKPKGQPFLHLYNLLAGYKVNEYFRAEANGQYRGLKYSGNDATGTYNQKINNYSLFLNGYVDIPTNTVFTPYVTAGLGYAHNISGTLFGRDNAPAANFDAPGKSTSNFAWNIGFGSKMKIYENVDLALDYRFVDLGKVGTHATVDNNTVPNTISATSQNLRVHQGLLSLIYNL
jgi:opacity protein-like surface antigen